MSQQPQKMRSTMSKHSAKQPFHDNDADIKYTKGALLCGYMREMEKSMKKIITDVIVGIIRSYLSRYNIFGIGKNSYSVLGLNNVKYISKYTRLDGLENLVDNINDMYVNYCSLFVIIDKQLYISGSSSIDSEGFGYTFSEFTNINYVVNKFTNNVAKIKVVSTSLCDSDRTFIYTENGKLFGHDLTHMRNEWNEINIDFVNSMNDTIIDIKVGQSHGLFLTKYGNVYGYGSNTHCQCGQDRGSRSFFVEINRRSQPQLIRLPTKCIKIAIGGNYSIILNVEKQLIIFGEFAVLNSRTAITPTVVEGVYPPIEHICCGGIDHCICIDTKGICYTFNNRTIYNPDIVNFNMSSMNESYFFIDGQCGLNHTMLLTNNNQVVGFGDNSYHQISSINDKSYINIPYIVCKDELGINEQTFIKKVYALSYETIIIIDPNITVNDVNVNEDCQFDNKEDDLFTDGQVISDAHQHITRNNQEDIEQFDFLCIENNNYESKQKQDKLLLCICGTELILTNASIYGPVYRTLLFCDKCQSDINMNDIMYHCPLFRTPKHANGYDVCIECAM